MPGPVHRPLTGGTPRSDVPAGLSADDPGSLLGPVAGACPDRRVDVGARLESANGTARGQPTSRGTLGAGVASWVWTWWSMIARWTRPNESTATSMGLPAGNTISHASCVLRSTP